MNYGQCQAYLREIQASGIKFGLDNVRVLLSAIENPHLKYPSVLVAGTNGKGSVCAFLSRILYLHDFRTGVYTSPHLVRVEERIRIGEESIPSRDFCCLLTVLKKEVERLCERKNLASPPTYFEHLTSLAFLYFQKKKVDMAVLEVGMGGRFDATNIVTPLVSVITTVSPDHKDFLGRTLRQIAYEKAGIIKPGCPVVCGVPGGVAHDVIRRRAEEVGAPFFGVFDDEDNFRAERTRRGFRFHFTLEKDEYHFTPYLPGEHQGRNGAVAIAAALEIRKRWKSLNKRKILEGIRTARWEGRLEVVSRQPDIILDAAHNEEGIRALAAYLEKFVRPPLTLVFAVMKDKDIGKMARLLFPSAEKIILTSFPSERAADPRDVLAQASGFRKKILLEADPARALKKALSFSPRRGTILVTGSLFLVGEMKKLFPRRLNA